MKRFFCLLTAAVMLLCLSSCGMTQYEDAESYFKISFPESMKVFEMASLSFDDPALSEYNINTDMLKTFKEDDGGVYYAKDEKGRTCSVAIFGSEVTIDIWELKASDSDRIVEVYKTLASSFNGSGYDITAKTEVDQGDGHYIYIELASSSNKTTDTIYMTTVKNGLQYSIMYYAPEMTDQDKAQAQSIFDTAYITKTISNTETQEQIDARIRYSTVAIIAVIIAIIGVTVFAVVTRRKEVKKKKDNEDYHSQF